MKPRTLIFLLVALGVLSAVVYTTRMKSLPQRPPEIGARVLSIDDINLVTRVDLVSGVETIVLARVGDQWVNRTRWEYPARFDALASFLRELDRLRITEIIRGGAEILPDVGLADEGTNAPLTVRLYAEGDKPTDELQIGKPRVSTAMPRGFGLPDSRFMRKAKGPVVLAEPFVQDVSRRPSDWIRADLLDIRSAEIQRMMAVPSNGFMYAIVREPDGTYRGEGALSDLKINAPSADLWFRALQSFTIRDVEDPAKPRESLGYEEADVAAAYLTNGLVIRVFLGSHTVDEGKRYAWFTFDYEGPGEEDESFSDANKTAKDMAERLSRDVAPWTFVLDETQANKLIFLREQLIAAPMPVESDAHSEQS